MMTSRRQRIKHFVREIEQDDFAPPKENQTIVKILKNLGNNLFTVIEPDQTTYVASLPTKFRKAIWVRRKLYVVVEPIEEGKKVKAEIVKILNDDCIRIYKADGVWPKEFDDSEESSKKDEKIIENKNSDGSSDEDDLPPNPNRLNCRNDDDDSDLDDSDSDSEEEESESENSDSENCEQQGDDDDDDDKKK